MTSPSVSVIATLELCHTTPPVGNSPGSQSTTGHVPPGPVKIFLKYPVITEKYLCRSHASSAGWPRGHDGVDNGAARRGQAQARQADLGQQHRGLLLRPGVHRIRNQFVQLHFCPVLTLGTAGNSTDTAVNTCNWNTEVGHQAYLHCIYTRYLHTYVSR